MIWRSTGPHRGAIEGLAGNDGVERSQERLALLAQNHQIPADRRVRVRPPLAAETARDLLLHLEVAQITLCLIVPLGMNQVQLGRAAIQA